MEGDKAGQKSKVRCYGDFNTKIRNLETTEGLSAGREIGLMSLDFDLKKYTYLIVNAGEVYRRYGKGLVKNEKSTFLYE